MTDFNSESTPVKIHLKTTITVGEESDAFELVSFGRYYEKGDAFFLKYDEVQEEGTTHTIVKVTDTQALILRSGAVKMRMVFNEEEEMNGSYESELGTLLLTTKTKKLSHTKNLSRTEGDFNLSYELIMQGSPVGDYEMSINFKEEE
ncbi:DUF1934 domain-containing protein [Rossellomorea aquimaris]|uniref:DUF1934 domain-containing protein n=1 Tax=Rossellomorea aquimaris TaxID=189382 RepID=A0A1J6VPP8_9BACI|nr:DUF1934 domain-containing protein [Rossellomorea aquimaris]OIU66428.1 hypothetical protein BHE18_16470 [Rossellomorea aquimaris]